jgi:hypothetical protein
VNAPVTEPAGLVRVDALADRLVAGASPVHFGVARSPAALEAVYRLRAEVVLERGWGGAHDLPGPLEQDGDDARAVHVVAWDGAVVVGTTRLVLPAAGRLLPTEEAFAVRLDARAPTVDVGRLCLRPPYRHAYRHAVLWGLLARTWQEMRARGFARACSAASAPVIRMYRGWGLEVDVLGAARRHWGEDRYPVLIRPRSEALAATVAGAP